MEITKLPDGMRGVDHVAYVTTKPKETVHFYRDILGFPLVHCITAPAWGNDPFADFVHFFFDIGSGAKIAFFYFFGQDPDEMAPGINSGPGMLQRSRHLAMLVDTKEELDAYERRFEEAGYPLRHRVMHELIESIYAWDPNGYNIEIARPLRQVDEVDCEDAELAMQALIDVVDGPDPSMEKLWVRKAELILAAEQETVDA